jgi:hypothetical protein
VAGQTIDPDRDALLRALHQSGAAFVVIGGAALQSHGLAYTTQDIDVTPARSKTNLQRLAATLNDLDCRLVVDVADSSQDVPVPADYFTADNLARQDTWNLNTRHGKLDITFAPAGFTAGYEQLRHRATALHVAQTSMTLPVAALEDVEHSKRTAGRPKDRDYLTQVGRLDPPR